MDSTTRTNRRVPGVRTALSFGVPEEDHDATVLKLGMIVARLGSDNIGAAERLAGVTERTLFFSYCVHLSVLP
jgi:hypothetical protein